MENQTGRGRRDGQIIRFGTFRPLQGTFTETTNATEVVIPDSDNELYLNLEDTQCQRLLLEEIAKRKQIVLEEFLFRNDSGIVRRGKDRFTNEVIFAFHKNEQHDTEKVHTR